MFEVTATLKFIFKILTFSQILHTMVVRVGGLTEKNLQRESKSMKENCWLR